MAGFEDLKVYQLAYRLAMMVFHESKAFPKEETYSLTDQVRRSSRSIVANLAEGYRKRQYPKVFLNKLSDVDGEVAETQVWLQLACDCGYLSPTRRQELVEGYKEVGRILGAMMANPSKFSQ
jgi:four helix bundle protein